MPVSLFMNHHRMMFGYGHLGIVNVIFGLVLFFLIIKMIIGISFMRKNSTEKEERYQDKGMSKKKILNVTTKQDFLIQTSKYFVKIYLKPKKHQNLGKIVEKRR